MKPLADLHVSLGDVDGDHKLDVTATLTLFGFDLPTLKVPMDLGAALSFVGDAFNRLRNGGK